MSKKLLMLVVGVALTGCVIQPEKSHSSASAMANRAAAGNCDERRPAFVMAEDVGVARLLGKRNARARTVDGRDHFVTSCPVRMTFPNMAHCDCIPKGESMPDFTGAELSISQTASVPRLYSLIITKGREQTIVSGMRAGRSGDYVEDGDADYLVGTSDHKKYFVYFGNSLGEEPARKLPLWKAYWLEVYFEDPKNSGKYLCAEDMPEASATEGYKRDDSCRQGGVGGGIEPGRH